MSLFFKLVTGILGLIITKLEYNPNILYYIIYLVVIYGIFKSENKKNISI